MKIIATLTSVAGSMLLVLPAKAQVVIISAKNPLTKLTKEQVAQLFLGQARTFITGGQAEALDLPEGNDLRNAFYQKITGKPPAQVKAYWSKQEFSGNGHPPKVVANSAELVKLVAENPKFIAYVDATAVNPSVKFVFSQ
jgi:ABC-type phosphate transport system substrate-binding protein